MKYRTKYAHARRSTRTRLRVEGLEDRTQPANGEWVLWLDGLAGANPAEQVEAARVLIADAHIPDIDVQVIGHTGIDGNVVIKVPELTPLEVLNQELHDLPGFVEILPNKIPRGAPVIPSDGSEELLQAPAPNVNVGLFSNEPNIAVNPLNPLNVVVANYNNGTQTLKISLDGGATFPITRNGVLVPGQTFFQGDDSLTFDAQGRLFWTYLSGGSPSGPNVCVLQVNPTTGAAVGSPTLVATSNLDKQWIAADANPASPFANNLYVIWHDFNQTNAPTRFARSTNQGVTWQVMPGNLHPTTQGFTWPSEITVAPNGDVWVAWHVNTAFDENPNGGVRMRRSTDGGLTFGPEITPFPNGTAATTTNQGSGLANKITGLHVWLQGSLQPRILVDPARPGNIYVICVDDPDAFVPTNDPSDVVIARSADNGVTWTRSTISQGVYGDSEFMPAAGIDAAGNIAVSWYDNRRHLSVPDSQGGTHYLLDLFTSTSVDGGLTFSPPVRLNTNTFDPELGAPDRFGNHTMRIGEYNGLALVNGTAYAVWTGNSATAQQVVFDKFSVGFLVFQTTPAQGSLVTTAPVDFVIRVNSAVNPGTVQASDLRVNGIAADSFVINSADTITFHFNTTPVTVEGLQAMAIAAGAMTSASGSPLLAFNGSFRYDPVPLAVTSTNPGFTGGFFTLPAPFTYDVTFSEAFNPATLQASDLVLTGIAGATVTGVTPINGNTTARFTIAGITTEGTLNASIAAGALTDPQGNPNLPFTGTYPVDFGTVPYPTPLAGKIPAGSLIYDPAASGAISFPGDTDSFTLSIDAGQTLTAVVTPAAGVRPTVTLRDPNGLQVASATAPGAGQSVVLQTAPIGANGTYTVVVGDAGTATGAYTVQVILNAALEVETSGGGPNNSRATAQNLGPSFLTLQTPQATAGRGAIVGQFNGNDDFFAFDLVAGQSAALAMATPTPPASGLFGPRTDVSVVGFPNDVTYGDLNGDTIPDMVTANDSGSVGIRLGIGGGAFGALTTITMPGASNPYSVVLGDINGDGRRDIVTSNYNSANVSVLLGNGAGGFGPSTNYSVGLSPYGLDVGDLNGDGFGDVVTANYNSNTVTVRLGSATGVLGLATNFTIPAAAGPLAASLRDMNLDNKLDVVVACWNNSSVAVLLGNGVGGLGAPSSFPVGANPWSIATGDLNGDSKPDVVTGNFNGSSVSVWFGNGTGGLISPATYSSGGTNPAGVAIGDVNVDGKPDIAVSNRGGNTAGILLNNGPGTFQAPQTFASGSVPIGIVLTDLNGDGLVDMSTGNFSSSSVSVWLNATLSVQLQIQDSNGTVLATGVPAANLRAAVSNFVAPAAGTYYARMFGTGNSAYNLVVTRSATFDTEPNDTFAAGQSLGGAQGALGAVASTTNTPTAIVPNANASVEGDFNNSFPFNLTPFGIPSMRYQQIYSALQFSGGGVIDQIRFRKDIDFGANFSASNIDIKINLSYAATSPLTPSTVFANNVGAGVVTVFDGLLSLSSTGSGSPNPFDIVIDVANLFNYNPAQGNLLLDVYMRNAPLTTSFDAVGTAQSVTSRIYSNSSVNDTTGSAFISGLVTRFDFVPSVNSQEDWYTVNVTSTANALRLETSTPADGPGQFVNTLNPHVELFDPSGLLVQSGTPASDGRNEFLQYQPLVTGAYRVRVTSEAATAGEYFFTRNFSPVVTAVNVTSPVNENGSATLTGTFTDPDSLDTHTVVIDWGPGEGTTTLNLPAGVFNFAADHQYRDDNPTGTGSDNYPISVTVSDNHGASGSGSANVTVNNVAPAVTDLSGATTLVENDTLTLTGTFHDPGTLDTHTVVIGWGTDEGSTTLTTAGPNPSGTNLTYLGNGDWRFSANHQYLDDNPTGTAADSYTVSVAVTDDDGGIGSANRDVTVNNVAPTITELSSATTLVENDTLILTGTFHDPGTLDTHTVVIGWGTDEGSTTLTTAGPNPSGMSLTYLGNGDWSFSASHLYLDDNPSGTSADTYAASVSVTDDDGGIGSANRDVTVANAEPVLRDVVAPVDPVAAGSPSPVIVTSSFTDIGTRDSYTVLWTWGDGDTLTQTIPVGGSMNLSAMHFYTTAGVYTVTVRVTDDDGGTDVAASGYVVIYDSSAGFATGGGWINSPAGAYIADPTLTGKATFGFVSKYQHGATIPDGNTRFLFHTAGFDFKSTAYDWLVVGGPRAQYKGTGMVNGVDGYRFLLTVIDGQRNGGGGVDRFRIKIWNSAGTIVYDNQLGASDTSDPTTALGGGSIRIQG